MDQVPEYKLFSDFITTLFPVAFDVASAAVDNHLRDMHDVVPNVPFTPPTYSPGLMRFHIYVRADVRLRIAIQKRDEQLTSLDAALIIPNDPILQVIYNNEHKQGVFAQAITITRACSGAIIHSIRHIYPEYGARYIEDLTPPPPLISEQDDWTRLFLWVMFHAPQISDKDLSKLIHREPQTIRNKRKEFRDTTGIDAVKLLDAPKRTQRGRSKEN